MKLRIFQSKQRNRQFLTPEHQTQHPSLVQQRSEFGCRENLPWNLFRRLHSQIRYNIRPSVATTAYTYQSDHWSHNNNYTMKTCVYALIALSLFGTSSNALLTPIHQSLPSSSLVAKTSRSRLGNDAANAIDVPRGGAKESGGTATIPNEVFNLVKSIVGAGVLSLPAGKYQNVEWD